jgi:hypothetical protein
MKIINRKKGSESLSRRCFSSVDADRNDAMTFMNSRTVSDNEVNEEVELKTLQGHTTFNMASFHTTSDNLSNQRRLKENSKGLKYLQEIASYPPLQTSQFNSDGTTEYRSKVQVFYFLPSICCIIILILVFLIPLSYE